MNQFGVGMNVKKLTHSQQQPQAPKLTKRSQQSDKQSEQCSVPPNLPYRLLVLDEVKCKTHTKQSTSSTQERLRLSI